MSLRNPPSDVLEKLTGAERASYLDVLNAAISDFRRAGECVADPVRALDGKDAVTQAKLKLDTWFPGAFTSGQLAVEDFEALIEWPKKTADEYRPGVAERLQHRIEEIDEQILRAAHPDMASAGSRLLLAVGDDNDVVLRRGEAGQPAIVVVSQEDDREIVRMASSGGSWRVDVPDTEVVFMGNAAEAMREAASVVLRRENAMRLASL